MIRPLVRMPAFHEPLGLLDHQAGDAHVAGDVLIVAAEDDFAVYGAAHVGDFLGPLVDEQDHHVDVGMVGGDAGGHLLQEHRLAGSRRGDDEAPLAQSDGGHEVHNAHGDRPPGNLKPGRLLGIDGSQVFEGLGVEVVGDGPGVDGLDLVQFAATSTVSATTRSNRSDDGLSAAKAQFLRKLRRHDDIAGPYLVVHIPGAQMTTRAAVRFENASGQYGNITHFTNPI